MNYYYRGNLAVDMEPARSSSRSKRTVKIKPTLPAGEKLLYLFFILLVVAGVGFVGTRYAQISEYNHEIQNLKQEIKEQQETNASLQQKIEEMSSRERIEAVARELGMVPASGAVEVIGGQPKKTEAAKGNH
ncbi:cell division protein FtsL [Brevibacillus sp. SYP-B805]|uniref:cell division protein FtsL n=1 Tax=Brevibacillus sp. SYP-B805 TaxID=1578199 RepID=UPI0013ECA881|nr:cell division protein FtsL [Brevibacillus sp. SYP-B805]NGQ93711.1 cell division protein FtsL [Brevibacillus sp. SYP-B805]